MAISVVLDACVLAPHPLFDTLLRLADAGLYRPLWSAEILAETERTITSKLGIAPEKARRRIEQMRRAFPEALVEDFEQLVPVMTNDPKDRHVLAAAVRAGAGLIVTANLADFAVEALEPYGVEAVHPDLFLLDQLDLAADRVMECLHDQRTAYVSPALSSSEFYRMFRPTVPQFAQAAAYADTEASMEWPQSVVLAWIEAVKCDDDDFWNMLDRDFRLALIQSWIGRNPGASDDWDRDELAGLLVDGEPADLFVHCRRVCRRELLGVFEGLLDREFGVGARPRPVSPGVEAVRVFDLDGLPKRDVFASYEPGASAMSVALLLRSTPDGWRILSVNGQLVTPGWPPVWEDVPVTAID